MCYNFNVIGMQNVPISAKIGTFCKKVLNVLVLRLTPLYIIYYPLQKEVKQVSKKQPIQKSGQIAPKSGQYGVVGPRGGNTGVEVTMIEGKPLPPTSKPGQGYILVDKTKHKDGK
jgi:hypothetical protein